MSRLTRPMWIDWVLLIILKLVSHMKLSLKDMAINLAVFIFFGTIATLLILPVAIIASFLYRPRYEI